MQPDKLDRKLMGRRTAYVLTAIACYFGTLYVLGRYPELDESVVFSALQSLILTIGAAVVGDTVRPSGQKDASVTFAQKSDPLTISPAPRAKALP